MPRETYPSAESDDSYKPSRETRKLLREINTMLLGYNVYNPVDDMGVEHPLVEEDPFFGNPSIKHHLIGLFGSIAICGVSTGLALGIREVAIFFQNWH